MKDSTEGSRKAKPPGNLAFWKKLSKLQLQLEYNEIWLDNYDTGETAFFLLLSLFFFFLRKFFHEAKMS